MDSETKRITLKEIYIIALAEGITAKEAGAKYNCNWKSLLSRGAENDLPPLKSGKAHFNFSKLKFMKMHLLLELKTKTEHFLEIINKSIHDKIHEKQEPEHFKQQVY
jgi:hypothetical protein